MFVAPPEKEVEWTDAGPRGQLPLPRARVAARRSLVRRDSRRVSRPTLARRVAQRGRTRAAAQDARHDPPRHRRHRGAAAAEHRGVGADGAGQRALRLQRADVDRGAGAAAATTAVATAERVETLAVVREAIEALVLMLSPFAPHTAEELWELLGPRRRPDRGLVAVVRRRGGEGRRDRRAGAGERQAARAPHRRAGCRPRRSCARRRSPIRPCAARRGQDGEEGGRGAGQAREHRGGLMMTAARSCWQ